MKWHAWNRCRGPTCRGPTCHGPTCHGPTGAGQLSGRPAMRCSGAVPSIAGRTARRRAHGAALETPARAPVAVAGAGAPGASRALLRAGFADPAHFEARQPRRRLQQALLGAARIDDVADACRGAVGWAPVSKLASMQGRQWPSQESGSGAHQIRAAASGSCAQQLGAGHLGMPSREPLLANTTRMPAWHPSSTPQP